MEVYEGSRGGRGTALPHWLHFPLEFAAKTNAVVTFKALKNYKHDIFQTQHPGARFLLFYISLIVSTFMRKHLILTCRNVIQSLKKENEMSCCVQ